MVYMQKRRLQTVSILGAAIFGLVLIVIIQIVQVASISQMEDRTKIALLQQRDNYEGQLEKLRARVT